LCGVLLAIAANATAGAAALHKNEGKGEKIHASWTNLSKSDEASGSWMIMSAEWQFESGREAQRFARERAEAGAMNAFP
jgi:hypothetical protein